MPSSLNGGSNAAFFSARSLLAAFGGLGFRRSLLRRRLDAFRAVGFRGCHCFHLLFPWISEVTSRYPQNERRQAPLLVFIICKPPAFMQSPRFQISGKEKASPQRGLLSKRFVKFQCRSARSRADPRYCRARTPSRRRRVPGTRRARAALSRRVRLLLLDAPTARGSHVGGWSR